MEQRPLPSLMHLDCLRSPGNSVALLTDEEAGGCDGQVGA